MTDGHCFISYSTHDGINFTRKLRDELEGGDPPHAAWYDKAYLTPSYEWDSQIVEAIKSSKCVLFLISEDSTKPASNCKTELTFALRYKKPIVPLLIQKDAEQPFLLGTREWIDFTNDFDAGMAKLRKFLRELEAPEGQLRELEFRLGDAEHALRRAKGEEEERIKAEVDELKAEIKRQKEIVKNPKKAQEQTQKNIQTGLERERHPEKPVAKVSSTKFINPPPGIAPNYFQDRELETKEVVKFLQDDAQRLMTIVGRGGVGKTAMVCRLLKGLEGGELPDGLGNMRVEGIVYLSESGSHRVNFVNIFYDLCKLLPSETAQELDAVYKNPQGSTESKMRALLEKFEGGRVVLLLDNIEPLVDTETFAIRDAELDEALRALLNGTHTAVNIVLTTRVAPRALNLTQPGRQRVLTLDEGLESPYAENILREMDSDGRMGLKSAPADLLSRARERTRGYPRALEALFAILASDRYTTLEELLAMPTPENVVEALVGEAFNRLDTNAQKVMQALAVYNRPVTPAVDFLLAPHLPAMDSAPILQRLANMHFARKESGRFYLHPVDREFAFGLIPVEELTAKSAKDAKKNKKESLRSSRALRFDAFTQHDLLSRAADYFAQARKPRAEWKKLDDLAAQLAEFDLRCAAGDYDTAANLLLQFDFDYLFLWGHYRLMIELHEKLKENIKDSRLKMLDLNRLGSANAYIGKVQNAISYQEQALSIARERKDKGNEGAFLGNLGNRYSELGNVHKAIEFYEQSLHIHHETGNRGGEGDNLTSLGNCYNDLGDADKAIDFHEKALIIYREIGDRGGEGIDLGNLGNAYDALGEHDRAIEFYEQALAISREINDRNSEGRHIGNLGNVYASLGDIHKAIKFYEQALIIYSQIGDRGGEGNNLANLGNAYATLGNIHKAIKFYEQALIIYREIGDRRSEENDLVYLGDSYSNLGDHNKSIGLYQQALTIIEEIGNRPDMVITLSALGCVYIDLDKIEPATRNFIKAIELSDEVLLPIVQNIPRCELAQAYLFQNDLVNARATIEAALQFDVPQNNHNATALHGIIALRQGDASAAHQSFTRAIAQADEILAKTPEYYEALDAKGLALCGLVLCRGAVPAPDGMSTTGRGDPAPTVDDAIETFRKARKIAPHAGVVKSVLRLFDELAKCDKDNLLKDVRAAVEGK